MKKVYNQYGTEIYFDAAVELMDDEIREEVHAEFAPCDNQVFFDAYAKRHREKYGETWEPNKKNPCM